METIFTDYLKRNGFDRFELRAILFDMDGVLYDSMKWHAKSWKETMDKYGINSTEDEFYLYEGMVGRNTINHLIKREKGREATEEEKDNIYKCKTDLFSKYNDNSLIPYAYDFVKEVSDEGLKCVIVTGSGQPTLIDKVTASFDNMFRKELMVTAFDVKHGKPHPEPYLQGLMKAGNLKPNQAVVIENAPRGIEAAVAAGVFTIAVNTGPLDDKVLADAGADIIFSSMEKLYKSWNEIYTILIR